MTPRSEKDIREALSTMRTIFARLVKRDPNDHPMLSIAIATALNSIDVLEWMLGVDNAFGDMINEEKKKE